MDVHSSGDHLIVGSLDRRLVWFDLDLSSTPYKTLKYHEKALRCVGFHSRYPLMASASDDGTVHVFHSMVYSDLMRNPLIVPVKILKEHNRGDKVGVLSFAFHPTQPWLFSAGADGKIYLYQDI
jgi:ribosome biogenesis protein ERB1